MPRRSRGETPARASRETTAATRHRPGKRPEKENIMSKKFYAVQIGNDYSSDWGSTRKREAIVMAHQAARENPGKEIRISICTTDDDFCEREIIVRDGSRT